MFCHTQKFINENDNSYLPKGDLMYDVKITIWKGLKVFAFAAVPAGLGALMNIPELIMYAPVIAGAIEAFNNWRKNKNY